MFPERNVLHNNKIIGRRDVMQKVTETEMKNVNGGDIVCYYTKECPHCDFVVSKWYIGYLTHCVAKYKAEYEYRSHLYGHYAELQ